MMKEEEKRARRAFASEENETSKSIVLLLYFSLISPFCSPARISRNQRPMDTEGGEEEEEEEGEPCAFY